MLLLSGPFIRDCSGNTATITSLHVVSNINSRFANTLVSSVVTNVDDTNHEAKFSVQLPEKAFVSNFSMFVNNTLYIGKVKSKKEAEKEYEEAKKTGAQHWNRQDVGKDKSRERNGCLRHLRECPSKE